MRVALVAITAIVLCALAAGSTHAQLLECRGAQKSQQVAELIFGRSIGGRIEVNDEQWMSFVDEEITPRFPDGLTVFDAAGQWRDKSTKKITRESSKIVLIVLSGKADDLAGLNEVVAAYKRSFGQQSVGMILRPACVSF
jgi:Protein of unknown function (DUF3574)